MRLSTGKLVSERILELLEEVKSRDMVPCEILLGETAARLLKEEIIKANVIAGTDTTQIYDINVSICNSELPEYVAIDCHI
jgi:hypothetical protein